MSTVEFRGVHKSFDATKVVAGVDLEVRDGELMVLVGPSGCGKSTLLRMVAGLEEPSRGEVRIGGRVVNGVAPRERDVAMVFQSYALYPHMTVRRNLAFGLEVRRTAAADVEARVAEAAEMLGLAPLLDRYPRQLSGGQRQRVAMGRAIVRRPKVFLFDEPLSNLDAGLRAQMRVELARLHRRLKTTMIYVTHDQVEAMTLADRIAVLSKGVLQQVGTPAEVYDAPANRFVASFIGSPSMNFLSGRLEMGADGHRVTGEGFCLPVAPERSGRDEQPSSRDVLVGIRPHDLEVIAEAGATGLMATVDVIEPMGWEALVYVSFGEQTIVVHASGEAARGIAQGAPIHLDVRPERVHLFDAETEQNLAAQ